MMMYSQYIKFTDPVVEQICVRNWSSDGIGLTMDDAAAVTSLGNVFKGNTSIVSFEELEFFIGLTSLTSGPNFYDGGAFGQCSNLEIIKLPFTLTKTGTYVFSQCEKLKNVVLPIGVTEINHGCFYGCKAFTKIEIPSSVIGIGDNTFTNDSHVVQIVSRPITPPYVGANSFNYLNALQHVYVPYSADHSIIDSYKVATRWSDLAGKTLELNPDGTVPTT